MRFRAGASVGVVLLCVSLLVVACGEDEQEANGEDTGSDVHADVGDVAADGVGDVAADTADDGGEAGTSVDDVGETEDGGSDAVDAADPDGTSDMEDATDTAAETGTDAADTSDGSADTGGADSSDGGETDTGGGITCNYQNKQVGVCPGSMLEDNGNCREPDDYESDESTCDDKDNDCDGTVDEGCPCAYDGNARGVCGDAKIDADSGSCGEPDDYESDETLCDGKDNDCDGDVDENLTQSCYTGAFGTAGTGVCQKGTESCSNGSWGTCMNETTPSTEMCNGQDDDCDGMVDEGVTGSTPPGDSCSRNCGCTAGVCKNGTCPHRVFVSSGQYDPQFDSRFSSSGLGNADQTCGTLASNENLGGTWKALMSDDGTAAQDRLDVDAPVLLVDGTKVADGQSDLWNGNIDDNIDLDPAGNAVAASSAWTGSNSNGRPSGSTCQSWTSNSGFQSGTVGNTTDTSSTWIQSGSISCDEVRHLYCIDGQ